MNYHHLTIEERSCIRKYYVDGLSYREIARLIGRNVSTVSREIRRNCSHMYDIPTYYPHTAQKKYLLRRSYCHRGMFHSQEVLDYIEEKLRATWSPEQIACTPCELKLPSWRTIYRWIYEKYLVNGNLKVLRHKGKSHGVKETRGKYSKGKSIRKRDKSVYSREEEGQEQEPPRPALPKRFPGSQAVDALHRRWAAEEAMMRRAVPEFSLQKELADPEMRRLMQLPGMRMLDAYRLAHYGDAMRQTARTVEQGVVERIRQRGARPAENGTHPGSAAVTGADVNRMTRSQREALERQALHGAKISF